MKSENSVLLGQIDDALADGIEDTEDALELAILAGLAKRLGAGGAELIEVSIWLEGPGESLLDETWQQLDVADYTDAIDGLLTGEAEDDAVKDAIFSWDELVAAMIWAGQGDALLNAAAEIAATVGQSPDTFSCLKTEATGLLTLSALTENATLYAFWSAIESINTNEATPSAC